MREPDKIWCERERATGRGGALRDTTGGGTPAKDAVWGLPPRDTLRVRVAAAPKVGGGLGSLQKPVFLFIPTRLIFTQWASQEPRPGGRQLTSKIYQRSGQRLSNNDKQRQDPLPPGANAPGYAADCQLHSLCSLKEGSTYLARHNNSR